MPLARSKVTLVPAVRGFLDPRQTLPHLDDVPTEVAGHGFGQLLIAAADVELLIGLAEDRQRVGIRLKTEQENQVESRLLHRIGAVLDDVGDVEERPERRAMTAGNTPLDVLMKAHLIQRPPGRRVRIKRRGEAGSLGVGGDSVGHGEEILIRLTLRIVASEEVVDVVGPVGLGAKQVVERQAKAFRQPPDRRVAAVDEFAAPLGDLVRVPVAGVAEHAAADTARGFVDRAADTEVGELERAIQAGNAGAHDDNRRFGSRERESRDDCRSRGDTRTREEGATGDTACLDTFGVHGSNLAQCLERQAVCSCDTGVTEQTAKRTQQRSPGHRDLHTARIFGPIDTGRSTARLRKSASRLRAPAGAFAWRSLSAFGGRFSVNPHRHSPGVLPRIKMPPSS